MNIAPLSPLITPPKSFILSKDVTGEELKITHLQREDGRERERRREREGERWIDRERERIRETDRQTEREVFQSPVFMQIQYLHMSVTG